jgi:hypothetical protein
MRNQFKASQPNYSSATKGELNGLRTIKHKDEMEKADQDAQKLDGNRPEETFSANPELKFCPNCHRTSIKKNFCRHHLIMAKILRATGMIGKLKDNTVTMCKPCEKFMHYKFKVTPDTLEKILDNTDMRLFGEWIGKTNIFKINSHTIHPLAERFYKELLK